MSNLTMVASTPVSPFEQIKQFDDDNNEFWSARDLKTLMEYTEWRHFKSIIDKAVIACQNSGMDPNYHIVIDYNTVETGHGSKRQVEDFHLTRYACYLIVQNSDPSKPIVALGQTYFAVQTRRQEISDKLGIASPLRQRYIAAISEILESMTEYETTIASNEARIDMLLKGQLATDRDIAALKECNKVLLRKIEETDPEGRYRSTFITNVLIKRLIEAGISYETEVPVGDGFIDLLTPTTLYEAKHYTNMKLLIEEHLPQILQYAKLVERDRLILFTKWIKASRKSSKEDVVNAAAKYGVEVLLIDDPNLI